MNEKDLHRALVSLGLNILEQEVIDMTNTVARNGLVFFPEFSKVVLKKFREDDEEQFAQVMFKVSDTHTANDNLNDKNDATDVVQNRPCARTVQGQEIQNISEVSH
jgi:Ca2+-binding EF-hand superfamily protein